MNLYYYKDLISPDLDTLQEKISETELFIGEESLLRLFENEIGVIDCKEDLRQYEIEYGYDKGSLDYMLGDE